MIYTIHGPSQILASKVTNANQAQISELVAVPENLAKWALIAPPIWLAFHKLWWVLAAYVLFFMAMTGLLTTSYWPIALGLAGLPGIYLFLEGRQLCRAKLETAGYNMIGVVDATSDDGAIARFVSQVIDQPRLQTRPQTVTGEMTRRWSPEPGTESNGNSIGLFPAKEI